MVHKLAFQVDGEESSDIVFAWAQEYAKRKGETILWEEEVKIIRRPDYDQYASHRRVPGLVLINDGWQLPCHECGWLLDWDAIGPEDEELELQEHKGSVFCSVMCKETWIRGSEQRRIIKSQAKAYLISKYPNLYRLGLVASPTVVDAWLYFEKGKAAEWRSNNPDVLLIRKDYLDSWNQYCRENNLEIYYDH